MHDPAEAAILACLQQPLHIAREPSAFPSTVLHLERWHLAACAALASHS